MSGQRGVSTPPPRPETVTEEESGATHATPPDRVPLGRSEERFRIPEAWEEVRKVTGSREGLAGLRDDSPLYPYLGPRQTPGTTPRPVPVLPLERGTVMRGLGRGGPTEGVVSPRRPAPPPPARPRPPPVSLLSLLEGVAVVTGRARSPTSPPVQRGVLTVLIPRGWVVEDCLFLGRGVLDPVSSGVRGASEGTSGSQEDRRSQEERPKGRVPGWSKDPSPRKGTST